MSLIVIVCILNHSKRHWFLNDVLNIAISMTLKLNEEMNHLFLSNALIDDDDYNLNIIKLETLAKNIKKEVIEVIFFPFFYNKIS